MFCYVSAFNESKQDRVGIIAGNLMKPYYESCHMEAKAAKEDHLPRGPASQK